MENLTKENCWSELREKYPLAMERFCQWIDEYKFNVGWAGLFAEKNYVADGAQACRLPKYHELPIALQMGIFMQFLADVTDTELKLSVEEAKELLDDSLESLELREKKSPEVEGAPI